MNNSDIGQNFEKIEAEFLLAARDGNNGKLLNLLSQNKQLIYTHDNNGSYAIHKASYHGHKESVKILLENVDGEKRKELVNKKNKLFCTPLHFASQQAHPEIVQLLIDNGANIYANETIHMGNPLNWTPLHSSVCQKNLNGGHGIERRKKVIDILLAEAGSNKKDYLNTRDALKRTALFNACTNLLTDEIETIKHLVNTHEADINIRGKYDKDNYKFFCV